MSGYFLALDNDGLIVERKKDENLDYETVNHLQDISDRYGESYLIYKATDFSLNEALNVIIHFVDCNSEFFYDNKSLSENIRLFFEKYQVIFNNESFIKTENILREGNVEELKKAFNSIMFYQYLSNMTPRQRKVRNLMFKMLKSLLTMASDSHNIHSFNNYIVKTDDEGDDTLDLNRAEVFLEGDLHFSFEIESL
jgi:hypothetical protein